MKFRHELKHYINHADYLQIKGRIKNIASLDKNGNCYGEYKIRSLYFDDLNDRALTEKLMGHNRRDKFRIRIYNDNSDFIRLEKKSKLNSLCSKTSAPITMEQCQRILRKDIDFLLSEENPLLHELYIKMSSEMLRPRTIVDYIREAYIYKPGNVRVTFDKFMKTGVNSVDLFNKELPSINPASQNNIILEVKFDEFIPQIIIDVLQVGERTKSAISKYALCRVYG